MGKAIKIFKQPVRVLSLPRACRLLPNIPEDDEEMKSWIWTIFFAWHKESSHFMNLCLLVICKKYASVRTGVPGPSEAPMVLLKGSDSEVQIYEGNDTSWNIPCQCWMCYAMQIFVDPRLFGLKFAKHLLQTFMVINNEVYSCILYCINSENYPIFIVRIPFRNSPESNLGDGYLTHMLRLYMEYLPTFIINLSQL